MSSGPSNGNAATRKRAPFPDERVSRAFEQLEEDEKLVEQVLAMTPEALRADLGDARVERDRAQAAEIRRRFEALAAELPDEEPAEEERASAGVALPNPPRDASPHVAIATSPEPADGHREGRVVRLRTLGPLWLLAAALAALGLSAGAAVVLFDRSPPPPDKPETPDQPYTAPVPEPVVPDDRVAAAALRQQAGDRCRAAEWAACLNLLGAAADKDPEGDRGADVQALRAAAQAGLLPERPHAPDAAPRPDRPRPGPSPHYTK